MPQTEAIVKQLRVIARQVGRLNPDESAAIHVVADRLHELVAEESDLLSWLESEQRFELAVDKVSSLLENSTDIDRRNLVENMREITPVLRGVRAARLRERFADLPDQLIKASASVLRNSLADRHANW
jgi:outer membrane translocation and assembly module TamA